jgi:predicted DCC family thiol-disulfide oxidoreductase YuxK
MKATSLCTALLVSSTAAFSPRVNSNSFEIRGGGGHSLTTSATSAPLSGSHARSLNSHEGSSTSTSIGSTSTTSLSSDTAALSSEVDFDWKAIADEVFTTDKRPIILFDGVCNLCNGGVNFALDNDSVGSFRFASLQSRTGQALLLRSGKKASDISSIVLVTTKTSYFKSDAVLRIARGMNSNPALPLIGAMGPIAPKFLRNVVYDFVADNRYRFGESEQCRMDFDNEFGDRFVSDP